MSPLAIDLYCGLGGWAEGFLAEGYWCVGFDIERHDYGTGGYPGQLVLQDALTLHGRQFKDAAVIVASPPCQKYSYMAMPWSKAKALIKWYEQSEERRKELTALFDACFRIQREASEAAGHHIPMVVENVRGAQRWVGRAKANYGSYYLWGDVGMVGKRVVAGPALMYGAGVSPRHGRGQKQQGRNFHFPEKYGIPSPSFHGHEDEPSVREALALKTLGHINQRDGHTSDGQKIPTTTGKGWFGNYDEHKAAVLGGTKQGGDWCGKECQSSISRLCSSKSPQRKAASAAIAKIPFPLAQHIARCFRAAQ